MLAWGKEHDQNRRPNALWPQGIRPAFIYPGRPPDQSRFIDSLTEVTYRISICQPECGSNRWHSQ